MPSQVLPCASVLNRVVYKNCTTYSTTPMSYGKVLESQAKLPSSVLSSAPLERMLSSSVLRSAPLERMEYCKDVICIHRVLALHSMVLSHMCSGSARSPLKQQKNVGHAQSTPNNKWGSLRWSRHKPYREISKYERISRQVNWWC